MDLVEIFEKILSIKCPHELIYYSLYYYGLHFSFKKGIDPLLERAIKWVKNKPPIHEREKEKMTLYASFCDTLIDKLKDPPDDNPFNAKRFNTDRHISVLPNLIESIFQENKEYKNLDRQVCLNLAISVLDIVWNNTPDEHQASIEKALTPFKEELQKTFQDAQKEILKILQHWEDQDYLPPKLVYESHFNSVEARREEELKRLEYYVPLELEVKLSQKGGSKSEEARSVLLDCLDKKRNAIIIGESGAGKTFTFLKLFGELKERYFNDEISFIPLFIELYKFNPPHEHVNLETFLQQYLVIDVNRFHRDKEKYILFLDGLNESPNIEEAFKEIKASQGMQIFLSTQREETLFEDKTFSTYYMLPLGEEEVIQYLSYCPRLGDKEKARTLYQKLDRVLKEQIKRPVFLFFISLLYENTGNIPTSLGALLSSFADFLCERKLAKSKIGIGTPFDSTYKRKVLPYLAFSMCKENKRELKEPELEKLFEDIIPNDPHDYDEFKKQVSKRYWLIRQSKTAESFEFTHELLRDYFAAVYIKNEGMAIDEVMRLVFTDGKPNATFVSVVQLLCGIESEERVSQLITGILKQDPCIAASCFTLSSATDPALFDNVNNAVDITYPKYLFADRLPQFYLRGLELMGKKEGHPKYAGCQRSLGLAYLWLSDVRDKEENLGRAIDAFGEALKDRSSYYANILNDLSIAYERLSEVRDTEENLRRAMDAYNKSLKSETFKKSLSYAVTLHNMGVVYWKLSDVRDKEENLGRAIDTFNEALKIRTLEEFPYDYATTQGHLGVAYSMLSDVRDKEENLKIALNAYNEALKVMTVVEFPYEYSVVQHNIGNVYQRLVGVKDKEAHLGRAMDAYKEALKVRTFKQFPEQYTATWENMGNVYQRLSDVKDKEAHLGRAMDAYKEALKVYNLEKFPYDYARLQNDLGTAYIRLSYVRDREVNLKRAIECHNKALQVWNFEKFPYNYAGTQDYLGNACQRLSDVRDKEANLRLAIEAYKEALRVRTLEQFPQQYAMTQNNLGIDYRNLADVRDREKNLGLAINAYNEALKVYTFKKFPYEYAAIQHDLGVACWELSDVGDREENLRLALNAFNEALKVRTFEKFPHEYATTQNVLGVAYERLSDVREKKENLESAMDSYNEALKVHTLEKFPSGYAAIQHNFGVAYRKLSDVMEKEENLRCAIDAFDEALKIRTFEQFPYDYARTQNRLGMTYLCLSKVRDKEENLNRAINAYNEALKVHTKDAWPWDFVEASYNLAEILNLKGDMAEAVSVMKEMLPVAEEVGHPELENYHRFYERLKDRQVE